MPELPLNLRVIVSPPFQENTYVAWLEGRSDCVIIDPGLLEEENLQVVDSLGLELAAIINTHGHCDHIAGNAALKLRWPDCPLVIGAGDAPKLTDPVGNLSAGYGVRLISPQADILVQEGDVYSAAGLNLEVHELPGHSSGHVIFVWKGATPTVVFGGDVLFAGGVGRTDFPDGDSEQLAAGIRKHLYSLPDDTIVLSGHGPATTIGREKRSNPFVQG